MKNKLKKILLGIALIGNLNSCKLEIKPDDFLEPNYPSNNLEGVLEYVATNIHYISDDEQYGRNYFAPPEETYENGKGDCEDFVILNMYLLKRDFGIEGSMVVGIRNDVEYSNLFEMVFAPKHAWIKVDDVFYESQYGAEYSFDEYMIVREYSYDESMEMISKEIQTGSLL